MDVADKVGSLQGRTHNAFGKPLGVKGFIREKVDSRGSLKWDTRQGGEKGPTGGPANDPSVIEWNYKIQPTDHSPGAGGENSNKAGGGGGNSEDTSPNSLASFKIDKFLLDAKPFALNNNSIFEHGSDFSANPDDDGMGGGGGDYWPFGEESADEDDILQAMRGGGGPDATATASATAAEGNLTTPAKAGEGKENAGEATGGTTGGTKRSGGKKSKKVNALLDKHSKDNAANNRNLGAPQGPVPLVPDKKMSISEITGTSYIKKNAVRIPVGLKDTPYFKSYAKLKEQSKSALQINKELKELVRLQEQRQGQGLQKDSLDAQAPVSNSESAPALHAAANNLASTNGEDFKEKASHLLDNININVPAPLITAASHGNAKEQGDSVMLGSVSASGDCFAAFGELRSPLDMAPPAQHPLLAAQTKALHAKVPAKTKSTPVVHQNLQKQQQQQKKKQQMQEPRRKTPPGKVATLHEMIAQARTVLGHDAVLTSTSSNTQAASSYMRQVPRTPQGEHTAFVPPPAALDIGIEVGELDPKEAAQEVRSFIPFLCCAACV